MTSLLIPLASLVVFAFIVGGLVGSEIEKRRSK